MAQLPYPKFRAFDSNGEPLAGGKLYTYVADTVDTAKTAYSDPEMSVAHANPIILSAAGEANVYLNGSYYLKLCDANDVEIWTLDHVEGIDGPPTSYYTIEQFASFAAAITYIGTSRAKLVIDQITSVPNTATVPANVELEISHAGQLRLANADVTINGKFSGNDGCFLYTGTGRVRFGYGAVTHVCPEWWGGSANGTTDNATPISYALDSIESGGTVFFGWGTYMTSTAISLPENQDFLGADQLGTIVKASAAIASVISVPSGKNSNIRNMTIHGADLATTCITMTTVSKAELSHLKVQNVAAAGSLILLASACDNVVIEKCRIGDTGDNSAFGVTINGGSNIKIADSLINTAGATGITWTAGSANTVISNNYFKSNAPSIVAPVLTAAITHPIIRDNVFESDTTTIALGASGTGNAPRKVLIANNKFGADASSDLTITACAGCVLMNNVFGPNLVVAATALQVSLVGNEYGGTKTISSTQFVDVDVDELATGYTIAAIDSVNGGSFKVNKKGIVYGANTMTWGAAAPASLAWAQGDVCWNTGATSGGTPGWVCTAAGTPGTWKAMANLA